jgi:hypothetical protein
LFTTAYGPIESLTTVVIRVVATSI